MPQPTPPHPPRLLDQVRDACRLRRYSPRTASAYADWVRRFILFHGKRHPREMAEPDANAFLSHLAVARDVAPSTQNQALAAILFLYTAVLGRPLDRLQVIRAVRPPRRPVILHRDEVRALLAALDSTPRLVGELLYGTGSRVAECLSLRVMDLDPAGNEVTIRRGKGNKDRVAPLPRATKAGLAAHLVRVREQHAADLAAGLGRAPLPHALAAKYPGRIEIGGGSGCSRRRGTTRTSGPGCGTATTSTRA
ncbi:phage integrase N-terminal SAM-like domain-containing protein [bacterium]|nr:phage integrase N-terminal SAM-like domain-containing protein [bacterium]